MEPVYNETPKDHLAEWLADLIEPWKSHRDQNHKSRWEEYYRIWRGIWKAEDASRASERSRLISPASQQAVESTVAEMEEATFGKGNWFDLPDDVRDQAPQDALEVRKLLREDFTLDGVPNSICEVFLNGAIYGTGIGKLVVDEVPQKKLLPKAIEGTMLTVPSMEEAPRLSIPLYPILPEKFFIDPSATTIENAMGCGYEDVISKHTITEKQKDGTYKKGDLGAFEDPFDVSTKGEVRQTDSENRVKLTYYSGLVPKGLLSGEVYTSEEGLVDYDRDLVEAEIIVANDTHVLKAVENPYIMKDRPYMAYQHDSVPNRFWGRGIIEKGYNPQKALDADLRARIDGLALSTHPMVAADATMLPRGAKFTVSPGKTILTQGDPRQALMPFNFGNINPHIFRDAGDLERMIQMGTGAIDSATPTSMNARNSTASGMSMMASGTIKRHKRTMQNVDRNFLVPLINKTVWRRAQFDTRYPNKDYNFMPVSTMGIMAREYEQQQLTNMLSTIPPGSPAYWLVLKSIYENSSLTDKDKMLQVAEQMMKQSMQPPKEKPDANMLRAQIEGERLKMDQQDRQIKSQIEQGEFVLKQQEEQREQMELQLEKYKADLDSNTKLKLKEADFRNDGAKEMAKAIQEMTKQASAPKRIVKDENGRPVGVETIQ